MPIAIDLHTHAKVAKSLPFRIDHFDRMVRSADRIGLSGFATTEHFDSPDYWEMANHLTTRFPYNDGHLYVSPGMTVLTGAEIDVAEGGHVIAIGSYRQLAALDQSFRPNLSQGFFPAARALIKTARRLGLTVIGAHPGRVHDGCFCIHKLLSQAPSERGSRPIGEAARDSAMRLAT